MRIYSLEPLQRLVSDEFLGFLQKREATELKTINTVFLVPDEEDLEEYMLLHHTGTKRLVTGDARNWLGVIRLFKLHMPNSKVFHPAQIDRKGLTTLHITRSDFTGTATYSI